MEPRLICIKREWGTRRPAVKEDDVELKEVLKSIRAEKDKIVAERYPNSFLDELKMYGGTLPYDPSLEIEAARRIGKKFVDCSVIVEREYNGRGTCDRYRVTYTYLVDIDAPDDILFSLAGRWTQTIILNDHTKEGRKRKTTVIK